MPKQKLFDGEEEEEIGQTSSGLKINEDYATNYNKWREKEVYQKLKDKYGEHAALRMMDESSESSTSESEDETGEGWGSDVEKKFFKTLACLKKRDPTIYNKEVVFFDGTVIEKAQKPKEQKDKPMFLRDYERHLVVERQGQLSDDEEPTKTNGNSKTYVEEQEELKKNLKKVLGGDSDEDENESGGGLLQVRPKTTEEKQKEDEDYKEWLKGQKENVKDESIKEELKPLKEYWDDPRLNEKEKFLRDYILNKRYLDPEDEDYIPTYEEIVHDSEGDLSEDEKTLERQEEFEHKFNFRFEEPDPEFIKRYPRIIGDSLRKKDESRKEKRDKLKERKEQEKQQKKDELKQLKKMKLQEIQEKIEKLKSITGNPSLAFQDDDLEEEFDPEKHDQRMQQIFNEDYYGEDEGDQKPEFPFDEEIDDENWDTYGGNEEINAEDEEEAIAGPSQEDTSKKKKKKKKNKEEGQAECEDPEFNMDCEYVEDELPAKKRKGKRPSQFAKVLHKKKPVFDPSAFSSYEDYLEEYYKLDYEDIIGDLPVRFKYRKTVPNDYGLDTEEILAARDKELNRWCSVKKTCQYRTEEEELYEQRTYKSKKQNWVLKKKILPSVYSEEGAEEEPINGAGPEKQKGTKRKHAVETNSEQNDPKRVKSDPVEAPAESEETNTETAPEPATEASSQATTEGKKKRKKKKKKKNIGGADIPTENTAAQVKVEQKKSKDKPRGKSKPKQDYSLGMTDERLKAYGFNPKKFKNKQKYGKTNKEEKS